ncbi:MAG TPA: zf-HC2 domain-containing protein [bacterium]|nr:zf-HC2 domain-containing protein [bacterium]
MDCRQYSELLTAFVDDEISATELVRLHEHLKGCPPCARRIESLKTLQEMFREEILSLEPMVPRPGFSRKILAGIAAPTEIRTAPRSFRRSLRSYASYASLAAAAVLLFLFWFLGKGEPPRLLPVDQIKTQEAQLLNSVESSIPDDLDEHILAASQNPMSTSAGLLAQVSSQE